MAQILQVNSNAYPILRAKSVRSMQTTFENYRELVKRDRKFEPSTIFRCNAGRNPLIWRGLEHILSHFQENKDETRRVMKELGGFMLGFYGKYPHATQKEFEDACKELLRKLIPKYEKTLSEKLKSRSASIFSEISPFVEGRRVLDVGAGDGKVGELVAKNLGKEVRLVDVVDYNESSLKLELYDGSALPFAKNSFDTSIVSVVFHHAEQPLKLLEEVIRVTNSHIVVIESVYFNEPHRSLNVVIDWFYNRVLHDGVNCPFNFQPPSGWKDTFRHYGLEIKASVDLGIDQPLAPEYHWLYALDVKEKAK